MSSSPHAEIIVGFEVYEYDFVTKVAGAFVCANGHPQTGTDPFCSKDGYPFEEENNEEFTEAFKNLAKEVAGVSSEDEVQAFYDCLWEEKSSVFEFIDYSNNNARRIIVGVRIHIDNYLSYQEITSFSGKELDTAWVQAQHLLDVTGLMRKVRLYHVLGYV